MTRRTLRKIGQWTGGLGVVVILFAWADSTRQESGWHGGLSVSGGWRPDVISRESAVHLVFQESAPALPALVSLLPSLYKDDAAYFSQLQINPRIHLGCVFPAPFLVKGLPAGGGCVGSNSLAGKIPPTPLSYGDPAIYAMLPYWLLLVLWCAGWGGATAVLMKKEKHPLAKASTE